MSHATAPRTATLAIALLMAAAACSGGGTDRGTGLTSLRSTYNTVGTWVYQLEGQAAVRPYGGAGLVADTLRLRASGDGTWTIVARTATTPPVLDRNDIDIGWLVQRDTVHVMPRCEPRELCDPLPGWYGTFGPSGELVLLPAFRHQAIIAPRVYVRVAR